MKGTDMQFDHLSSDQFWDLVYDTAKNRKRKKKLWQSLMSPEYADIVRDLSDTHISRILTDVDYMLKHEGAESSDPDVVAKLKARDFIQKIRGQAIHAIDKHNEGQKNVRRYEKVSDLIEYSEYLKDTIEDLRAYVTEEEIDFELFTDIQNFRINGKQSQIDEWIDGRKRRRDG